jgi:hypothetical protein
MSDVTGSRDADTSQELRAQDGLFKTLMEDYGSSAQNHASDDGKTHEGKDKIAGDAKEDPDEEKQKGGKLMLDEERAIGEVSWKTYGQYIQAIGAYWWTAFIFLSIACVEGSRVTNSLFLGFWSQNKISGFGQGAYMGIYAGESRSK